MVAFLFGAALSSVMAFAGAAGMAGHLQLATFLNGGWAEKVEDLYDKALPHYALSTYAWSLADYTLFREGRPGVVVGDDGWLFTAEEFSYDQPPAIATDYITTVRDELARKRITLTVALVPSKARVYAEHLGGLTLPAEKKSAYSETLRTLRLRGLPVADIYDAFATEKDQARLFLKTDTHWTPDGASLAARVVVKALPPVPLKHTAFQTRADKPVAHMGDLLRYIPLGPWQRYQPETFAPRTTRQADNAPGTLFGDAVIPVALVGTSYSADPLWNFAGFLKQELQADVLNAADPGLGPFATMRAYLHSEAFRSSPPKLVIWEIPERYLTLKEKKS